jgi:CRP/FNR family transcriptional regulator
METDTAGKITGFFSLGRTLIYKKGETILDPQTVLDGAFFIVSGSVKMTAISENGDESVINIFRPGAFFPMSWILNDTTNRFFYQAEDNLEIKKVSKEDLLNFLNSNPDVVMDLVKRIYRGLDGYFLKMEQLMSGTAFTRLLSEIWIVSRRNGSKTDPHPMFSISEKDLAAQTGLTRETVSREFQKMIQQGLISYDKNRLKILNPILVERYLNGSMI